MVGQFTVEGVEKAPLLWLVILPPLFELYYESRSKDLGGGGSLGVFLPRCWQISWNRAIGGNQVVLFSFLCYWSYETTCEGRGKLQPRALCDYVELGAILDGYEHRSMERSVVFFFSWLLIPFLFWFVAAALCPGVGVWCILVHYA